MEGSRSGGAIPLGEFPVSYVRLRDMFTAVDASLMLLRSRQRYADFTEVQKAVQAQLRRCVPMLWMPITACANALVSDCCKPFWFRRDFTVADFSRLMTISPGAFRVTRRVGGT